ncbi:MAG: PilT/PilU family type 4a pilus ATPase [Venatoribacter sp.]
MAIETFLQLMVDKGASDLFITTGVPPSMKINGKLMPLTKAILKPPQVKEILYGLMTEKQQQEFEDTKELNFAVAAPGIGRFRANAFFQRGTSGLVLRRIETRIPTLDELGLPSILNDISMTKRGLVLFVGATGTGKSTSLAAMIGHRNKNSRGHILCIEDPIEFIHSHDGCIVTQREVGMDTASFDAALKSSLRQAPDVIMIGELRTAESMKQAIAFAETGHLCLATLHANNANQALDRVINFFPAEQRDQAWLDLSLNLKAIVAQQLVATPDGQSRRAVIEILLNSPLVSDMIRKGEVHEIKSLMAKSTELGMQTFDQALLALYQRNEISYETALAHADSANDLRLMIKLGGSNSARLEGATQNLRIED